MPLRLEVNDIQKEIPQDIAQARIYDSLRRNYSVELKPVLTGLQRWQVESRDHMRGLRVGGSGCGGCNRTDGYGG